MQEILKNEIKLIESTHKYELFDDPDFEFTSCTTFVKYFFRPFDKIGVANSLTSSHPKYDHLTPQQLVQQWDKIAEEGTFIHAEVENYVNDCSLPTHPKSLQAAEWLKSNIIEKDRYDVYSEVIVYSKELSLAGTIDLLIYDKINDEYKIVDWKTNKRIDFKSFNSKMGIHEATQDLMDCNFYHYSMQLSLYRYILETYYGLSISGSAISHLTQNKILFHKTEYYKDEIVEMLKADRELLKQKSEDSLTTEFK